LRLVYYAASRGIATLSNLDMQQCPKTFCNNVQKYFAILSKKCLQKTIIIAVAAGIAGLLYIFAKSTLLPNIQDKLTTLVNNWFNHS
ncbi:MAG: hypothetical protein MR646_04070, partial [Agathobacter sp.]|nr:hypothetical protein [Agathobacter sp.]